MTHTADPYFVAVATADFFAEPLPAGYYPQPAEPEPRTADEQAADADWDAEQDCDCGAPRCR